MRQSYIAIGKGGGIACRAGLIPVILAACSTWAHAPTSMNILAISGSTRLISTNTALLKAMQAIAPEGLELAVFDRIDALPVFSPDAEGDRTPVEVLAFLAQVAEADGVLISSPEYVRAIPGGLKNAIDWMVSRDEIIAKPIALVHASHRGDDMLASLRLVLSTVSTRFFEQHFLRFALIGKSPVEIAEQVGQAEYASQVVRFLRSFMDAIEQE